MGAQNTATLNFGAWPGTDLASVAVTGQASIASGSLVECWVYPTATADHSIDEHIIDPPHVVAGTVVAGTGFTIYGLEPPNRQPVTDGLGAGKGVLLENVNANQENPYGQWTIAWCWN